jgi:hypothetical protein
VEKADEFVKEAKEDHLADACKEIRERGDWGKDARCVFCEKLAAYESARGGEGDS